MDIQAAFFETPFFNKLSFDNLFLVVTNAHYFCSLFLSVFLGTIFIKSSSAMLVLKRCSAFLFIYGVISSLLLAAYLCDILLVYYRGNLFEKIALYSRYKGTYAYMHWMILLQNSLPVVFLFRLCRDHYATTCLIGAYGLTVLVYLNFFN